MVKNPLANAEDKWDMGLVPGLERSPEEGNPTHPVFLPGEAHGQRSLAGYSLFACVLSCFSCVWLFATLWTIDFQTSLSMGFSRQEYWNGFPCPSPGDLPNPGIESTSLKSPELAGRFFTTSPTIAQGTLLNALWCPEWWRSPKGRGYMYTYGWFTLLYSRN